MYDIDHAVKSLILRHRLQIREYKNEIGTITSLEHIETLKRKTSLLTLWKTTYSKSKDEVLWQVTLDAKSHKIKLMHINWENL